ncbi:fumarate reductase (CoM/CoB) subunit TfrA [Methanoregula formicica]|uniref:Succinate dehydrogenase/fumarate reductase flavoprotein subunit n=1 Tax=Methanoregula formicica (strain DSM 22288 / NBRC 105244 / SMSP) TaxID=593750 RepID=L0HAW5_METFS|nr:fumarate reductase (CoM/CoB) subunit TfrA [Methanoregula formicica]AGB01145.1 succinate dehydrogenase/fumarate reductase flavoprotein subunit [Methanoregula formicica SMSP]
MRADEVTDCHVLVIGSGGAGVRAAIEASQYGETVLISKTIVGKGGCTTMAEGGYNAVLRDVDTCGGHYEDTMKGGAFLNEHGLVDILTKEAPLRMGDLVKWGAVFDFTENDEVAQRPFGGQRFPRTCYAGDRTGHEMMMTLTDRLLYVMEHAKNVTVLQEYTVIDLLKDGDSVIGALALDEKGDIVVMKADSTILATGGGTRVYDISTNSSSGTGDGYAMGYRAGAELIDMEMVQFHPTGAIIPYDARGRLVTEAVRGEGGVLKNANGERFMKAYDPARMELSTRDVVARAIATEIQKGRGTKNGGVYLDVTHLSREQIETRLPVMLEQFLKFGVDIRTTPMEVAPTAHHIMGGLRITPECRTTLAGLFACGEVSGGVHGANRLGGNALAETQVFGKRAGEAAGKAPVRKKSVDERQVDACRKRLDAFLSGSTNPVQVRTKLQLAMWEGAGIFRTAITLEETLHTIRHLQTMNLKAASARNLAECCIVQNMCLTASLICRSALLRTESRGAHVRTDVAATHDAEHSPFGHTFVSVTREGIETHEVKT